MKANNTHGGAVDVHQLNNNNNNKGRVGGGVRMKKSQQQQQQQVVVFQLKHKVVVALNKLADRDTYQLGVDELHKTAQSLTPDAIPPFLSCILDTDSDQKSGVRKECIRVMATLVTYHHPRLMAPHLPKMVASIVKRLKDPDSVVRDACVDALGLFASKFSNAAARGGDEHDDDADAGVVFVALVRPLFEALGEQNKQMQSGSALCLARVIDNTHNPPLSLLHRMLSRTTKMLKNPHFMAKPPIIDLNRSIILAGGAPPTHNLLSTAMASIQESLKNNDWSTRKAASIALGEIASSGASFLGSFKASCVRSLESCRFDKVKPVRDTVLQALQCWKTLPGTDTPEPSEAGSSIKENFCGGDYSDLTSASEFGWKDVSSKKVGSSSTKGRIPLSVRKKCQTYTENPLKSKDDDWRIEIAVPKTHPISEAEFNNEESEGSSVTKTFERMSTDVTSMQDIGYEYVHMDDKQECSSVSNLVSDNFDTKLVKVCHDGLVDGLPKPMETDQQFAPKEIGCEEQMYSMKIRDRRSLDSTATESALSSHCCLQMANEMVCIRKQLVQIEDKQSNLMDLLQVFTTGIMDSLSMLQSRVVRLEDVVDSLAQDLVHREELSSLATSKLSKQSQILHSPRLSTCTPRPSIDIHNRQPSLLSVKSNETWEENAFERSLANTSTTRGSEMWANAKVNVSKNRTGMDMQKSFRQGTGRIGYGQVRNDHIFGSASGITARKNGLESKNSLWKRVKGFLCEEDLDSAYMEALCSRNEHVLVELFDLTGPVLECLSSKTVSDVLSTLVVDLSTIHGPNYLVSTAKARQKFLSVIQEAVKMDFSNPLEKRCVNQIAVKLHHAWGKKMLLRHQTQVMMLGLDIPPEVEFYIGSGLSKSCSAVSSCIRREKW
ncbi:Coatomer beta subunit [Trema orientale]|uniref:Coatomer beta subunit n=1 Tax=Trema orientale TaxID=63057 RepID=A0A2P5E726_TREOI|nr:Coatomer beta subunit [Trema orientale]